MAGDQGTRGGSEGLSKVHWLDTHPGRPPAGPGQSPSPGAPSLLHKPQHPHFCRDFAQATRRHFPQVQS